MTNWKMVARDVMLGMLSILLLAGLLVGTMPRGVHAEAKEFTYRPLAFIGNPIPGPEGGFFFNDFEPGGINNRGDVLFGADVTHDGATFEGEGVFLARRGSILQLARTGGTAPGGGIFTFGFLGPVSLNDEGDAALAFLLEPFALPFGMNSGVYRFSQDTSMVTAVVVPGVTPAPGGGLFVGAYFGPSLNNRGDLVFPGIVPTDKGIHLSDESDTGLWIGVFNADKNGNISSVVSPGDPAPGGGTFDIANQPWANNGGNVAFVGHVAGNECRAEGFSPQAEFIGCLGSVYVKKAATDEIHSIASAGESAPRGGVFRQAFGPVMNDRGDIVFLGDLTSPPGANQVTGVYLHSKGETIAVSRPGDPMPGGGTLVTASILTGNQIHVNNPGQVVFNAVLSTDDNADGTLDTGLFLWSKGQLRVVARTGTVIPGVGTINDMVMRVLVFGVPPAHVLIPNSGAVNNDRGQVLFGAMLTDGRGVLLIATPLEEE